MARVQNSKKSGDTKKSSGVKKTNLKRRRVNNSGVATKRVGGPVVDARNKIIANNRSKVVDARDKLASLAKKTDARQKLQNIRNRKEGKVKLKLFVTKSILMRNVTILDLL